MALNLKLGNKVNLLEEFTQLSNSAVWLSLSITCYLHWMNVILKVLVIYILFRTQWIKYICSGLFYVRLDCLLYGVEVIFLFLGLVVSFENAAPLCFMLTICKNVVPECSRMLRWNYMCWFTFFNPLSFAFWCRRGAKNLVGWVLLNFLCFL